MEAGRILFAKTGFEATSVGAITARAGAASGAFYVYFRSKRQLLVALMNELLQRLANVGLEPRAGSGSLRAGLRNSLATIFKTDLEYFGVIRAWQEAALTDAELGRMQARIHSWTEARILRVFQRLQQHPNARSGQDLAAFGRMMDRHFWGLLARGSGMTQKELLHEINTAADVIYHYLFRDTAEEPAV